MVNNLKIVWICHFTNSQIQLKLNPLRKLNEIAPWISLGIDEVKKNKAIELHIISPHRWISGVREFRDENIFYHFFNSGIPYYGRHWPRFFRFDIWTNFLYNRYIIKKLTLRINPQIVHLHGFENAYYSSSILDLFILYPTIVTVQGFSSLQIPDEKINGANKIRMLFEKRIMKNIKNFGVRDHAMKELIIKHNPNAKFFYHEYFMNIPDKNSESRSYGYLYDLVYFARISKEKGIEDLIKVVGKLKLTKPDIRVAIMGSSAPLYLGYLKNMAKDIGCLDNFDFLGFQKSQEDIYEKLYKSKIAVLPTYNDNVPGLVIESMLRKVPVVTYKTGGLPDLNSEGHNIEIVDQGDINGLESKILNLLNNPSYAKEIAERASKFAFLRWDNTKALNDILNAYETILSNQE